MHAYSAARGTNPAELNSQDERSVQRAYPMHLSVFLLALMCFAAQPASLTFSVLHGWFQNTAGNTFTLSCLESLMLLTNAAPSKQKANSL